MCALVFSQVRVRFPCVRVRNFYVRDEPIFTSPAEGRGLSSPDALPFSGSSTERNVSGQWPNRLGARSSLLSFLSTYVVVCVRCSLYAPDAKFQRHMIQTYYL